MNRCLSSRLRPICFPLLIIAVAGILVCSTSNAESLAETAHVIDVDQIIQDELCGWGTHDSCPLTHEEPVVKEVAEVKPQPTQNATTIETSLAGIATATCATMGISVEQFVEPFAMVGPHLSDSLQRINEFQQWWEEQANKSATTLATEEQAVVQPTAEPSEPEQQTMTIDADPVVEYVASPSDLSPVEVSHVPIVDFESEIESSEPWSGNLASATETDPINDVESVDDSQIDASSEDDHPLFTETNDEEIRDALAELATEEPLDTVGINTDVFGPSVLLVDSDEQVKVTEPLIVTVTEAVESTDFGFTPDDQRLVGTAPMIFSIDEAYMPYDLAVRDYQLDSLSSLAKRPFCVLSRVELSERDFTSETVAAKVVIERDQIDQPNTEDVADTVLDPSLECLLEEGLWNATLALEQGGAVRKWLRAEIVGQQVAAVVVKHNQFASEFVNRLAEIWPEATESDSNAGALLLARAGAIEIEAPKPPVEIADAEYAEQMAKIASAMKPLIGVLQDAVADLHHGWRPLVRAPEPTPAEIVEAERNEQMAQISSTFKQWIGVIEDVAADLHGQWRQIAQAPPWTSASENSRR